MQFGVNSFVWISPFTSDGVALFPRVREMGFDIFEFAVEDPANYDLPYLKQGLSEYGLQPIVCGVFGPDRDLSSDDPQIRQNAADYLDWCIGAASALGSPVIGGPMYASVGKARLLPPQERQAEWQRAVTGVRQAAQAASRYGVKLAIEPLNRFETDLINTVAQGLQFVRDTGEENVGFHLDTFHMHLEEKSSPAAIRAAGNLVFHFHACENDRGIPGTGQVNWNGIAQALRDIQYGQAVVIESFTPDVTEIARAVCIWREIAPDQDTIARTGLDFLKNLLH